MVRVLRNDFKWSVTRDRTFRTCPRQYWFNHYGFWSGWEPEVDARTREIYLLKQLQSRPTWVGDVVHRCIKQSLENLSRGIPVLPLEQILAITRDIMRREFRESRDRRYQSDPRAACALFEHEYRVPVTDPEWLQTAESVDQCLRNFYMSPVWENLSRHEPDDFLEVERFSDFELDDTIVTVKLDCAVRESDHIVVWDWKTGRGDRMGATLQLACYAFYIHQRYHVPIPHVHMRRFELMSGEVHERRIGERELNEVLTDIRGSIADMRAMLDDPDRNIAGEDRFRKVAGRQTCTRCNFVRICEPALAPR